MATGLFSIGVSGIKVSQMGLLATEHNIVNANTAGYSRQMMVQSTSGAVYTGQGAIGQGVEINTVKRMYDNYLSGHVNSAQSSVGELEALHTQLSQIDNLFADSSAGLSPALQSFFTGVQSVASDPSSAPARQSMVSSAQTLVSRFDLLNTRLSDMSEQINSRIENAVTTINSYAKEIASFNQRIVAAQGAYGQPANDLLDQRDQVINELNKLIKVTPTDNGDGSVNLFFGNGQQLVVGTSAMTLTAQPSQADASRTVVGLQGKNVSLELPESSIVGGELGGLLEFRSGSLDKTKAELGMIATSLALTFNAQHALGQDMLGNIAADGGSLQSDFFTLGTPSVLANAKNTGSGAIAVSFLAPQANASTANDGGFYTNLKLSDYQVKFGAAGAYTITRLSDNEVVATGSGSGTVSLPDEGLSFDINAVGAAGDRFVVKPYSNSIDSLAVNSKIVADPKLIAAAAPVRVSQAQANTGNMLIGQGSVGVGYSAASLPQTLTASATSLDGATGSWTATYADGTAVTGSGSIPLNNAGKALDNIEFSGMSFSVSGTPAVGDQFTFARNTDGVQDGRNVLQLANLQTTKTMSGGTASYQSTYSKLVADNGIQTSEAKIRMDAQTAVLDQATASRDSLSAVNLDEEAANLIKYQQAYQAAAKILSVGSTLFDTLLSLKS